MLSFFARFIGCINVFFYNYTIMFVRVIITMSKKKTKCAYAIGLSSLQKTVVAMRMLSLGTPSKVQK